MVIQTLRRHGMCCAFHQPFPHDRVCQIRGTLRDLGDKRGSMRGGLRGAFLGVLQGAVVKRSHTSLLCWRGSLVVM